MACSVSSHVQKSIHVLTRWEASTTAGKGCGWVLKLVCDLQHTLWAHTGASNPYPYLCSHPVPTNARVRSYRPSQYMCCLHVLTAIPAYQRLWMSDVRLVSLISSILKSVMAATDHGMADCGLHRVAGGAEFQPPQP